LTVNAIRPAGSGRRVSAVAAARKAWARIARVVQRCHEVRRREMHGELTVLDLPGRARILPLHADGVLAFLQIARLVDDQYCLGIAELAPDELADVSADCGGDRRRRRRCSGMGSRQRPPPSQDRGSRGPCWLHIMCPCG
jgi:hypothetical protein